MNGDSLFYSSLFLDQEDSPLPMPPQEHKSDQEELPDRDQLML